MSKILDRAASKAKRAKRKHSSSDSDSDDSDVLIEKHAKKNKIADVERSRKDKQDEFTTIKKQLDAQCEKNARELKRLADARLQFPVFYITIDYSLTQLIALWSQTPDAVPPPASPNWPAPSPAFTAKPNPFACLKTHPTMAAINSAIIPWLIAEYGIYYFDWDNADTATLMIAHVITSQQLGGYTERTFPEAIDGHRVEQVAFTKFVLRTAGNCSVALFENNEQPLTHCVCYQERPTLPIARIFGAVSSSCFAGLVKKKIAPSSLWLAVSALRT